METPSSPESLGKQKRFKKKKKETQESSMVFFEESES
jgi:hypothetical protein